MDEQINARLTHIEKTQLEHTTQLAHIAGTVSGLHQNIEMVRDHIENLNQNSSDLPMLHKGLLVAIVVQSVLYGVTTPDLAKATITSIFGAN